VTKPVGLIGVNTFMAAREAGSAMPVAICGKVSPPPGKVTVGGRGRHARFDQTRPCRQRQDGDEGGGALSHTGSWSILARLVRRCRPEHRRCQARR
jgi:hypothetical protein